MVSINITFKLMGKTSPMIYVINIVADSQIKNKSHVDKYLNAYHCLHKWKR